MATRAEARRATPRDARTGAADTKAEAAEARSWAALHGMAALTAATRPLGAERLAGAAVRPPRTMLFMHRAMGADGARKVDATDNGTTVVDSSFRRKNARLPPDWRVRSCCSSPALPASQCAPPRGSLGGLCCTRCAALGRASPSSSRATGGGCAAASSAWAVLRHGGADEQRGAAEERVVAATRVSTSRACVAEQGGAAGL